MREYKCDQTHKIIPDGDVYFQIMPMFKGISGNITKESQSRMQAAQEILCDLDFSTPKAAADYIAAHQELQNL